MIVDDMDIVRRELKRLKIWGDSTGFEIIQEAHNGQEALELIKTSPVDLVVTDIKMPKINGIELLETIVSKSLCTCVVLLSDFSDFNYARQGIILGAFDFLPKPVNEQELICLLQRAKEYLDQDKKEKERIRKLEDLLSEKQELLISTDEIAKLIELIQAGDRKAYAFMEHMINRIGENANHDVTKFESAIIDWIQVIISELKKTNPLLEQFIDIHEIKEAVIYQCNEYSELEKLFIERIKNLLFIVNLLNYCVLDKGIIKQVCRYVILNIENDISLANVADSLYMNKSYISEVLKQKIGVSFTEYVTYVKMARAKVLILRENLKTYEIADKLGYKDTEYFSKVFKRNTGLTPTDFRQQFVMTR
jgi:two-component system response regulator YesN